MICLKIPVRQYREKCTEKFAIVPAREVHCFRRYRPVRFVIHEELVHVKRQRVCFYAVTELSTLTRISGGITRRDAIRNTRARMDRANIGAKGLLRQIRNVQALARSRAGRTQFATA